ATALADLLPLDDPGRELRAPAAAPPHRAGLAVHAVYGVVSEEAVRRAITAVVAAGLAERARARPAHRQPVTRVRVGWRSPVPPADTGGTVPGPALLDLFGVDAGPGAATIRTARGLTARLAIRREGGWLVGGPDPARGPGPRATHELRWVEANLTVPL